MTNITKLIFEKNEIDIPLGFYLFQISNPLLTNSLYLLQPDQTKLYLSQNQSNLWCFNIKDDLLWENEVKTPYSHITSYEIVWIKNQKYIDFCNNLNPEDPDDNKFLEMLQDPKRTILPKHKKGPSHSKSLIKAHFFDGDILFYDSETGKIFYDYEKYKFKD